MYLLVACSNIVHLQSTTFGAIQVGNVFPFAPDISSAKGAGSDIIKLLDSMPEVDAGSTEGKISKGTTGICHWFLKSLRFTLALFGSISCSVPLNLRKRLAKKRLMTRAERRTFLNLSRDCLSMSTVGLFISYFPGDSILKLVARVLSYLVARNVRSFPFNHLR